MGESNEERKRPGPESGVGPGRQKKEKGGEIAAKRRRGLYQSAQSMQKVTKRGGGNEAQAQGMGV